MRLIERIREKLLESVVDHYVSKIYHNPEKNLDKLFKKFYSLTENETGKKFFAWILENPGPRKLFINIFNRDYEQVRIFFRNMILYSGLEWLRKNKELDSSKEFPAPFTLLISPTMACNLECDGCYAKTYDRKNDMSKEFFDSIISQAEQMGTHFFTILGGEPSLKISDFKDIFKKHNRSIFQMFTNGTYLNRNKKTLEDLLEIPNLIPALSVDGTESETDSLRGKGVYKEVSSLAEKLYNNGRLFGISLVLTSSNYNTLSNEKFYDDWINRGALFGWIFLYMPVSKGSNLELMPTPEQRKNMYEVVNYVRNNKPFFLMDFWNDAPAVGGCIAARRYAHVTNDGYLEPCIFVHLATHNLKEVTLKDAWDSEFFKAIRLHQPHTNNLLMPCMIIDNPKNILNLIEKYKPISTDNNYENRIMEIKDSLREYSNQVKTVLDPFFCSIFGDIQSNWNKKRRNYEEGFDRIWLENLSNEERKKYEHLI
ncbi:MAG: radical SAM protein [Candidatus Woesearchaeota archaeon]